MVDEYTGRRVDEKTGRWVDEYMGRRVDGLIYLLQLGESTSSSKASGSCGESLVARRFDTLRTD